MTSTDGLKLEDYTDNADILTQSKAPSVRKIRIKSNNRSNSSLILNRSRSDLLTNIIREQGGIEQIKNQLIELKSL